LLAATATTILAWAWWPSGRDDKAMARSDSDRRWPSVGNAHARSERAESSSPASTNPPARGVVSSDGSLIVPATDADGRPAEPRVLMPVTGARSRSTTAAAATNTVAPTNVTVLGNTSNAPSLFNDRVLTAQVALARQAISSGPIDAMLGPQTRAALRAFQEKEGLSLNGRLDAVTEAKLQLDLPLYSTYVVSEEDLARLLPLGKTWLEKSEQPRLDYESVLELVGEKTHSNPKLLRWLNPDVAWDNVGAGSRLKVVNAEYPAPARKAAFIRIFLSERRLQVFGENTNLLAHFPCSIAARVEKRPVGEALHISVIAPDPNYTFDPEVFPESAEARQLGRKLILQPGPNNPVGSVWLGLDKPGYGIHGTPKPEEVGRTESHGCFRLANWNATYLLGLVAIGTPVYVEP
jgi:lipoprotein-anchoring transpeptidase ErfK/SrfK